MFELRPYQKECIDKIYAAKERGVFRPLVVHPTGAGKTIIMSALIKSLFESAPASRALVLAHRDELIQQARDKLLTVWPGAAPLVGVVKAERNDVGSKITVASVQSLCRPARLEAYIGHGLPELTVTDECLDAETKIYLPGGLYTTIKEVVYNPNITHVLSYNEKLNTVESKRILRKIVRPINERLFKIKVETDLGRNFTLTATGNHKIWTEDGYKRVDELNEGDIVKVLTIDVNPFYCCKLCGAHFNKRQKLSRHYAVHDKNVQERIKERCRGIFTCPYCRKTYNWLPGYKLHIRMHEDKEFAKYRHEWASRKMSETNKKYNGVLKRFISNETRQKMIEGYKIRLKNDRNLLETNLRNFLRAPFKKKGYKIPKNTCLEKAILNLRWPEIDWVGDGKIWIDIPYFDGIRHKNPDFIVKNEKKVIEIGDVEYWHTIEQIREVIKGYEAVGYQCLYLTNEDLKSPDWIGKLYKFVYNHKAKVISIQRNTKHHRTVYNLEVEDNHNYFANGILVSNCHHSVSSSYRNIYETLHLLPNQDINGRLHLGVTATPDRLDKVGLKTVFDSVVHALTIGFLIESGYLVPVRGVLVNVGIDLDETAVNSETGDFSDASLAKVMESPAVVEAIARAWTEKGENRKTVAFTPSVRTAAVLAEALQGMGVAAAHVSGETPENERRELLRKFSDGEIRVLANCSVLTEGWDEPSVECVLMARPTKSRALWQQAVGRGLRPAPWAGKADCLVLDVVGNSLKHKLVTVASLEGKEPGAPPGSPEESSGREPRPRRLTLYAGAEKVVGMVTGFGWLKMREDFFALYASDRNVAVMVRRKNGLWQAMAKDFGVEGMAGVQVLSEGPDKGYVFGAAENYAAIIGDSRLLREDREWRSKPPSEAQVGLLERMAARRGIRDFEVPSTRGEASDLITKWHLEELLAGPTERQVFALKRAGMWEPGLTKMEASRRLARVLG